METILTDDSPLAAYLEGKGEADEQPLDEKSASSPPRPSARPRSFAPPTSNHRAVRGYSHGQPATRLSRSRLGSDLRNLCASAISSTLGSEDNARFLEHFRYIIIASQLLDEHVGPTSSPSQTRVPFDLALAPGTISLKGACLTASAAFFLVSMISWVRDGRSTSLFWARATLVLCAIPVFALFLYAYSKRQWLKYLRTQAVDAVVSFTDQVHNFESSSSNTITLIQEVELVSRGYRISAPLPPISRLEGQGGDRRCARLRRELSKAYRTAIEASLLTVVGLGEVIDPNDLERFLEVYDIRWQDLEEARLGFVDGTEDEQDSIRTLRVHQFRLNVLRRLIMCSLLSITADGHKSDILRWRAAIIEMDRLSATFSDLSTTLSKHVNNEDIPTPLSPSSPTSPARSTPQQAHLHSQVRRIATLTTSIRSLQAKLYLLREDSTRALSSTTSESDVSSISAGLREQYENLGTDLTALMSAWEAGKNALQHDITRHSRRVSRSGSISLISGSIGVKGTSSPLLSTASKSGGLGLATLIEDRRAHALRNLNGENDDLNDLPLSPPATDDGNGASNSDAESRDEVFEATALPRSKERSSLTRDQRIAKMKEERVTKAQERESRDAGLNMVKELKGVIRLRPQRQPSGASQDSRKSDPMGSLASAGLNASQHGRISSL